MRNALFALALLTSSACAYSPAQQTFFKKNISVDCLTSQEEGRIVEQQCDHNRDGNPDFFYYARYQEEPKYGSKKLLLYSQTQVDVNFDGFVDEETVCVWNYSIRDGKYLDRSWNCKLQRL